MRGLLLSWIMAGCLALSCCAPLDANAPPQPVPEKKEPEAPKVEEKKFERDNSSHVVHYTLAGIATLIIMILICMPARRE